MLLGAEQYTYVTGQHADLGLQIKGMIQELQGEPRLRGYLNDIMRAVEERLEGGRLRPEEVLELARLLRQYANRLEGLARRLREYASSGAPSLRAAPNETVARPQPIEAPPVTAAQTTEARPAKGEAYRTVSMLVGLTPEEVEREVRRA